LQADMQSFDTVLRNVAGFAQLDRESLDRVAEAGELTEVGAGDVLFREGGLPASLYVLVEGQISLTGTAPDSSTTVIDVLGPASSFVLASVLADEPYLMGAQAVSGSLLVAIPAASMREVVMARPSAAMAMIGAMAGELAGMTRQVVDLKVRVAAQRLGTYLLGEVREPATNQAAFRLSVAKGLLAPWLGCRAENLSRAFTTLRAYGVETHGSRVVLHDIARLRAYAGAPEARPVADADASPVEQAFGDAFRLRPRGAGSD